MRVSYTHPKFIRGDINTCQQIQVGQNAPPVVRVLGRKHCESQEAMTGISTSVNASPTSIVQTPVNASPTSIVQTPPDDDQQFPAQSACPNNVEPGSTSQNVMVSCDESQSHDQDNSPPSMFVNENVSDSNRPIGFRCRFAQAEYEESFSTIASMSLSEITLMQESLERELNASRRALEELTNGTISYDLNRMINGMSGGRQVITPPPPEPKQERRPSLGARAA